MTAPDDRQPAPIGFLRKYVAGVLNGTKTATVRRFLRGRIVGPWLPGDVIAATCGGKVFALLDVLAVEAITLDDITDTDARSFGASSVLESRETLRGFYPKERVLQVVRFRVHKPEGAPVPVVYGTSV